MKRTKPKDLNAILASYLREEGLETPLLQHRITHQGWAEIVGPLIASHTESLKIVNQTLYVQCNHASIRQEIVMRRTEIAHQLNLYVDAYIISDIVVK